jgi:signal transduction histidine kinase
MVQQLTTEFAPAERAPMTMVNEQAADFANNVMLTEMFSAVPDVFLVLNDKRQVVFANKAILKLLGYEDVQAILGMRPGELLDCVHANKNPGGCGTTEFCKTCGAVNAILSSLRGKETVNECRITQKNGNALDLRVWAKPFLVENKQYSLFAVQDISHEKRRRTLERIFFHDILNTAGGLQGISELLQDASVEELDELKTMVYALAERLVDEIQTQRILAAAETNDLAVSPSQLHSVDFMRGIVDLYKNHEVGEARQIRLDPNAHDVTFTSDRTLLGRVIGNLLKNALEASPPRQTVTMGCQTEGEAIEFWVHNTSFMPRPVQLQMFQRSFSTKGAGRGLGTYSIKLLSERYLQGSVRYTTNLDDGTTFFVRYPINVVAP